MRRELLYLQDIIEAADAIRRFLREVSEADFLQSDLIQSAVLQKLMIIGEASARVSDDTKIRHSEIPWKQITGFRNIAVHAYFTIKLETVWETATTDVPVLREQILKILQNDFPDFELRNKN